MLQGDLPRSKKYILCKRPLHLPICKKHQTTQIKMEKNRELKMDTAQYFSGHVTRIQSNDFATVVGLVLGLVYLIIKRVYNSKSKPKTTTSIFPSIKLHTNVS